MNYLSKLQETNVDNLTKYIIDFSKFLEDSGFKGTSSSENPVDKTVVFVSPRWLSKNQLDYLEKKNIYIILRTESLFPKRKNMMVSKNCSLIFTIYHNYVYRNIEPPKNEIDKTAIVHPTSIVGDGLQLVRGGSKPIHLKCMGNIILKKNVVIGPYVIIRRGKHDPTIIDEGTTIGGKSNIGHDCYVGKNCTLTLDINMGGFSRFEGDNWVGMGVTTKNRISICKGALIGMGAVVTKNITEKGKYAGIPSKKIK